MFTPEQDKKKKDSDIEANTSHSPPRRGTTSNNMRPQGIDLANVNWGETCCGTKNKKWAWAIGVGVVSLILLVILIKSLQRLESTEYGLEYHPRKKELDEAVQQGGLHAGPPGFEFVKFPATFIVSSHMI